MRYLLSFIFITIFSLSFAQNSNEFRQVDKLNQVYYHISNTYVDTINEHEIVDAAIIEMLDKLDPHSVYIPAKKVNETEEPLKGNFEGVGIQFNIFRDTIMVVTPISGGPSDKLGILAGDKIILIDDSLVAGNGINNRAVVRLLRGPKGTQVNVGIKRRSEKELIPFTITRGKIPIYSVDAAYMTDKTTGYIKINSFSATTLEEFDSCITMLKSQGLKDLILDLTGNGGGYMHAAQGLAEHFLDKNQTIVYTLDRDNKKQIMMSSKKGEFKKGKLIVMINEGSASASEIVSGAIQDHDRGLIVGRRSFGKGLVQAPIQLGDGAMLRLTIARYYTPSGRSIQKPYDNGAEAYFMEQYNRYKNGELTGDSIAQMPDSLKYTTANGRTVYGGGGIMPDIYVNIDTVWFTDFYSNVTRKGILHRFCLEYTDEHRAQLLDEHKDIKSYIKEFNITDSIEALMLKHINNKGIEFNADEYAKSKEVMHTQIKAFIARNLWGSTAFYMIINDLNEIYIESVLKMKEGWKL
jgi:carboxyl-terminal processing protease